MYQQQKTRKSNLKHSIQGQEILNKTYANPSTINYKILKRKEGRPK